MSHKSQTILLVVLAVWLSAAAAIYLAMGRPDQQPRVASAAPVPPPPAPGPPAAPAADELSGYRPCPTAEDGGGQSRGVLRRLRGRYDPAGRYVVEIDLDGRVTAPLVHEDLGRTSGNVTFVDFQGSVKFETELHHEAAPGPVTTARLGLHPGFTRLSLNYHAATAPKAVGVEILCRPDAVALRYTFDRPPAPPGTAGGGQPAPAASTDPAVPSDPAVLAALAGPTGPSASSAPSAASVPGAAGAIQADPYAAAAAGLPAAASPDRPAAPLASPDAMVAAAVSELGLGTASGPAAAGGANSPGSPDSPASPDSANASASAAASPSPSPSPSAPADELAAYGPCLGDDQGKATFTSLKGHYDAQGRYVLLISLQGRTGSSKTTTDHTIDPVATFIDLPGRYALRQETDPQPAGPVRQARLGLHPGFLRLSLTYREGQEPQRAKVERRCLGGAMAVRYTFEGGRTTAEAKRAASAVASARPDPEAPVPADLAGYGACRKDSGPGQGRFGPISASYAPDGRFVAKIPFTGRLGATAHLTDHSGPMSATFIDFKGRFDFDNAPLVEPRGPASRIRMAGHDGAVRLSLTWREDLAPKTASVAMLCSEGALALVYDFDGWRDPAASAKIAPNLPSAKAYALAAIGQGAPAGDPAGLAPAAGEARDLAGTTASAPNPGAGETPDPPNPAAPEQADPGAAAPAGANPSSQASVAAAASAAATAQIPAQVPAPAADPATDLAGYRACPKGAGPGQGRFGPFSGAYAPDGRFVAKAAFKGRLGPFDHLTDHSGSMSATFIDFKGLFDFDPAPLVEPRGPASRLRLAAHDGATRLSLTWREGLAPKSASVEVLCSEGSLALVYDFDGWRDPAAAAKAAPNAASSKDHARAALAAAADGPSAQAVSPDEPPPPGNGLEPSDELAGYQVCRADQPGRALVTSLSSHYDDLGRLILIVGLEGMVGQYKTRNMLGGETPSSYLDLAGRFEFTDSLFTQSRGPLRQVRLGQHGEFLRLALTWRESRAPAEAEIEVYCLDNSLAVRYTFEPDGMAVMTAKNATIAIPGAGPGNDPGLVSTFVGKLSPPPPMEAAPSAEAPRPAETVQAAAAPAQAAQPAAASVPAVAQAKPPAEPVQTEAAPTQAAPPAAVPAPAVAQARSPDPAPKPTAAPAQAVPPAAGSAPAVAQARTQAEAVQPVAAPAQAAPPAAGAAPAVAQARPQAEAAQPAATPAQAVPPAAGAAPAVAQARPQAEAAQTATAPAQVVQPAATPAATTAPAVAQARPQTAAAQTAAVPAQAAPPTAAPAPAVAQARTPDPAPKPTAAPAQAVPPAAGSAPAVVQARPQAATVQPATAPAQTAQPAAATAPAVAQERTPDPAPKPTAAPAQAAPPAAAPAPAVAQARTPYPASKPAARPSNSSVASTVTVGSLNGSNRSVRAAAPAAPKPAAAPAPGSPSAAVSRPAFMAASALPAAPTPPKPVALPEAPTPRPEAAMVAAKPSETRTPNQSAVPSAANQAAQTAAATQARPAATPAAAQAAPPANQAAVQTPPPTAQAAPPATRTAPAATRAAAKPGSVPASAVVSPPMFSAASAPPQIPATQKPAASPAASPAPNPASAQSASPRATPAAAPAAARAPEARPGPQPAKPQAAAAAPAQRPASVTVTSSGRAAGNAPRPSAAASAAKPAAPAAQAPRPAAPAAQAAKPAQAVRPAASGAATVTIGSRAPSFPKPAGVPGSRSSSVSLTSSNFGGTAINLGSAAPAAAPAADPKPSPATDPGPLSGFKPCSPSGSGHGSVTALKGKFLAPDRYVVFMELNGEWGGHSVSQDLDSAVGVFTSLFQGRYQAFVDFAREIQGPVGVTRVAVEDDRMMVSLNFLEDKAPGAVKSETLCRGSEMALVHTLEPRDVATASR